MGILPLLKGDLISKVHKIHCFVFYVSPYLLLSPLQGIDFHLLGHGEQMAHLPVKWELVRGKKEEQRRFSGLRTVSS